VGDQATNICELIYYRYRASIFRAVAVKEAIK